MDAGHGSVVALTSLFTVLIFLAATQDIAVDGWAIELLRGGSAGFGSTCQTLGMALGWFLSYTAFLALNDPEFCKAYVSLFLSECPAVSGPALSRTRQMVDGLSAM